MYLLRASMSLVYGTHLECTLKGGVDYQIEVMVATNVSRKLRKS